MKQGDLVVHLASTQRGALRVGLSLEQGPNCVTFFRSRFPRTRVVQSHRHNGPLIVAVTRALHNESRPFVPPLDVHLTPFQWQVLKAAADIPFGETRTYGHLAARVQNPGAARAVGQVMHRNPLPLISP